VGTRLVRAQINCRVGSVFVDVDPNATCDVRAKVLGFGVSATATVAATSPNGFQRVELECRFAEAAPRETVAFLLLEVRTVPVAFNLDDGVGSNSTASDVEGRVFSISELPDEPVPGPVENSPSTRFVNNFGTLAPVGDLIALTPNDRAVMYPANSNFALGVGSLTMLQVRSFHVEVECDRALYPQALIAPGIPVAGASGAAHVIAQESVGNRARCLSMGEAGVYDEDAAAKGWAYPEEWRYAQQGQNQALFRDTFVLNEASGRIVVYLVLVAYHDRSWYFEGTREGIEEDATESDWTFTTELTKWRGGPSFDSITLQAETVPEFRHFGTSRSNQWPLLHQLYYRHNSGKGQRGNTLKEGQLFDADLGLIRLVKLELPYTALASDLNDPFDLIVTANTSGSPTYRWNQDPADNVPSRLHLVCVGSSVWRAP